MKNQYVQSLGRGIHRCPTCGIISADAAFPVQHIRCLYPKSILRLPEAADAYAHLTRVLGRNPTQPEVMTLLHMQQKQAWQHNARRHISTRPQ